MKNAPVPFRALALHLGLALTMTAAFGCKKKGDDGTNPPDNADTADPGDTGDATGDETGGDEEAVDPGPPQEPDPPDIADARVQYYLGNYMQVSEKLTSLTADLTEREQYRASGLGSAWLALAAAHDVAENAKAPSEYAISMGERTKDPEVVLLAHTAHGAYLVGVMEFDAAAVELEKAVNASPDGPDAPLALVLAGEARMNMAFGEGDKIKKPEELDAAIVLFDKAAAAVKGETPADKAIKAKITESQAAALRYKGDRKGACAKADEAIALYGEAGASDFVVEGAQQLKQAAACK